MTGRRTVLRGLGVVVSAVVVVVLVVASRGTDRSYPVADLNSPQQRRAAPAWTQACRPTQRSSTTRACRMVSGRVLYVQHHDPDGDGDRHLLVLARFGLRVVKVPIGIGLAAAPGRGRRVSVTSCDLRGSRGDREIRAERLSVGGRTFLLGDR